MSLEDATPATPTPEAAPSPAPAAEAPSGGSMDDTLSKAWDALQTEGDKSTDTSGQLPEKSGHQDLAKPAAAQANPAEAAPATPAPHSWQAEMQAKWAALPPDVQTYIAQREAEAHRAISEQGQAVAGYQRLFDQFGVPKGYEHQLTQELLAAQHFLNTNPVEGLKWLAQSYGVDLNQIAQPPEQATDDLFRDPRLDKQVLPEMQRLQQTIQGLAGHLTQQQQAAYAAERGETVKIVESFAKDKPLWAEIEQDVVAEITALKATQPNMPKSQMLEKAYERALWANPAARQKHLEKIDADKRAEAAKKASEAKRIASMNVRTGASASTPASDAKWDSDDAMSSLYDRIVNAA